MPSDETLAVAAALTHTEERFKNECDDQALVHAMFVESPAEPKDLGASIKRFTSIQRIPIFTMP